jgi:hypothetical protein
MDPETRGLSLFKQVLQGYRDCLSKFQEIGSFESINLFGFGCIGKLRSHLGIRMEKILFFQLYRRRSMVYR